LGTRLSEKEKNGTGRRDGSETRDDVDLAIAARLDKPQADNMSAPTLKAAILVVSTTASRDPSTDSSGGLLKDVFEKEGGGKWEVVDTKIVSDEVLDIQRSIMGWTDGDSPLNVIITTGGTGFATKDITPEVCDSELLIHGETHSGIAGCHSSLAQASARSCTWHACCLIGGHAVYV